MEKRYRIIIGSPVEYEKLVAYVVIDGKHVALLNQEKGKDHIEIQFFNEPKIEILDYDIFVEALQKAKDELIK